MASEFKSGSSLKRLIRVYGVPTPVIVSLSDTGVEMRIPGYRHALSGSWDQVALALKTPGDVPSYLEGRPIELLKHQALKKAKKGGKD